MNQTLSILCETFSTTSDFLLEDRERARDLTRCSTEADRSVHVCWDILATWSNSPNRFIS